MAKSLRTTFIRVTAENHTEKGIINYTSKDILNILNSWSLERKLKYYYILHTSDKEDLNPHFHIVIDFESPVRFETVKKKFPYGQIEPVRSTVRDTVRYLIHKNSLTKQPYLPEEVVTNSAGDLNKYLIDKEKTKIDYLALISSGEIKEFEQFEVIPASYYINNKHKIENAFNYFKGQTYMDKTRNIKIVFITGQSGTGKSTFVYDYAKKTHSSICVSSSSNDPLQDYQGEDILFLDDLKVDAFPYEDFLKILDPHYKSTAQSRYHNKFFLGHTIFIASVTRLEDWYYYESPESKKQLYRRIKDYLRFSEKIIEVFRYNDKAYKYLLHTVLPNNTLKNISDLRSIPNIDFVKVLGWKPLK